MAVAHRRHGQTAQTLYRCKRHHNRGATEGEISQNKQPPVLVAPIYSKSVNNKLTFTSIYGRVAPVIKVMASYYFLYPSSFSNVPRPLYVAAASWVLMALSHGCWMSSTTCPWLALTPCGAGALPPTLARTTAQRKEEEGCYRKMAILFTDTTQTQRDQTGETVVALASFQPIRPSKLANVTD